MDIKKLGLFALGAVGLLAVGFGTGRYAAPDKIVYQEKIKEVEKVVYVSDTEKILNALKTVQQQVAQQKDVKVKKVTVKKPDGTVTTTTETEDKSKTDTKTDTKTETQEKTKVTETLIKEKIVEKEVTKIVERNRPDWRLQLQTGFDVAALAGRAEPYSLLPSSSDLVRYMVLGVGVEHRLIGPVSAGVWANTHGMGGLTLSLEF